MLELTCKRLRELLRYEPDTGDWYWRVRINSKVDVGDAAGTISVHGYRIITLGGTKYRASRLAFLYMTGSWPVNEVDHENRCKLDDRWINLRDVTGSENQINRDLQSNNTSGFRGVHWHTRDCKWIVQVKKENQNFFVGQYDSLEEAVVARDLAAKELHGSFAVLNQSETLQ